METATTSQTAYGLGIGAAPGQGTTQGQATAQALGQGLAGSGRKRSRLPIAILAGVIALLVVVGVAGAAYFVYTGGARKGADYVQDSAFLAQIAADGTAYLALPDGTLIEIDDEVSQAAITADREHVIVILEDGTLYVTDPEQSYKERIAYDAEALCGVRNDGFYYLGEDLDYDTFSRVTYEDCESLMIDADIADHVLSDDYETSSIAYATTDGAIYRLFGTESDPERIGSFENEIDLLCMSDDASFIVWDDHHNAAHTIMMYDNGSVTVVGKAENDSEYQYDARLSEDQELCVVMRYGDDNLWILHRGEEPVHASLAGDAVLDYLYTEDGRIQYSGADVRYLYVCAVEPDDSSMANLYAYTMDGERERVLSNIRSASILNGRLVYTDVDYNLYTADLDGLSIKNEMRIARDVEDSDYINMVGEYVYYMKGIDDNYQGTLYCYRFGEEDSCRVARDIYDYAVSPDGSTAFLYREEDTDDYTMMSWNYGDEDTSRIARNLNLYGVYNVVSGLYSAQYDCSIIDPDGFTYTRYNGETEDGNYDLSLMYYDGESSHKLVDYVE